MHETVLVWLEQQFWAPESFVSGGDEFASGSL
jgi:hypothetical protein